MSLRGTRPHISVINRKIDSHRLHTDPVSLYGFTLNGFTVNVVNSSWYPEERYFWIPYQVLSRTGYGNEMTVVN